MKRTWSVVTVALLSVVLTACPPKGEGTASNGTTGDILVGEYGSLSGAQATFGQSTHQGIILAIEQANAAGGVKGRQIKVLTEDDQSKQEEAANAVTKLISQNSVQAIIGEVASSASIAAAPICQSNKVPMITPSSTNEAVTKIGDYIFRMCFIDNYQGPVMARFALQELHSRRAAILTDVRNDYSTGLTKVIEETINSSGTAKVVGKQSYSNGDSDFRPQLTTIKSVNPDVIFIPGYYGDAAQIVSQARDLGIKAPFVGGDGWESPKLLEIGGKALNGCYYANHYFSGDPAAVVRNFVDTYQKRWNVVPGALDALGYDAANVLVDALKRAGTTDEPALRDAIASTKDFPGVTGNITLGPDRNPVGKKIVIIAIKDGKMSLATTIDPSTANGGVAAQK